MISRERKVTWYALFLWMSANHSSFCGVYCADLPEVDTGNAFCRLLSFQCCILLIYVCLYYHALSRLEEKESSTVTSHQVFLVHLLETVLPTVEISLKLKPLCYFITLLAKDSYFCTVMKNNRSLGNFSIQKWNV